MKAAFFAVVLVAATARDETESWLRSGESITGNLPELAERQGLDPNQFCGAKDISTLQVDEHRVIVALTWAGGGVPGKERVHLTLVSTKGKIWDHLRCATNSRYGRLQIDLTQSPDRAYAVISLDGSWFGWYAVEHQNTKYTFWRNLVGSNSTDQLWKENGLCRVGISGGHFEVLYPKVVVPDLRHAKALQVTYEVDGKKKSLPLVDRSLLAKINIGEIHYNSIPPGRQDFPTVLTFTMSDGSIMETSLVVPAELFKQHYGIIQLRSNRFHDALAAYLFEIEGRPVRLVRPYDAREHPSTASQQ